MTATWLEGWAGTYGGEPPEGVAPDPGTDRMGDAIASLIALACDMDTSKVRPENQNGPTGNVGESFATYRIIATDEEAVRESSIEIQDDGTELEVITQHQVVTVSFNFYRGKNPKTDGAGLPAFTTSGFDMAKRLPLRMQLNGVVEARRDLGIGYRGAGRPRDLTSIVDAHWESRGQVDLYFTVVAQENGPISTFQAVGGTTIKVEEPDGTIDETTI